MMRALWAGCSENIPLRRRIDEKNCYGFAGYGTIPIAASFNPQLIIYSVALGQTALLQTWLSDGMSMGNAAAFMITGPATKITNLGAVKIVLGIKRFVLYIAFVMIFSLVTGPAVNLII